MFNLASSYSNTKDIIYLPVDKIMPNPYQPRKRFDMTLMKRLANSIKIYGVLNPIIVRYINSSVYEVVAGERRLKACKTLGISEIPCFIINVKDKISTSITIIENLHRHNLNFIEYGEILQTLMVDFGYSVQELSKCLCMEENEVMDNLRIISLNKNIKNKLIHEELQEGHALALLKIEDESLQMEFLNKFIKYDMNVKKSHDMIDSYIKKLNGTDKKIQKNIKAYLGDIRFFTNTIKNAVDFVRNTGIDADYKLSKFDRGYEINIKVYLD